MSLLCSTMNCTAKFFACMSVISRSMLWSRIMVGAKTTAKFLGDIYTNQMLAVPVCILIYPRLVFPTKFSLSRLATRARWNMRNSRQSRCCCGSKSTVLRRCTHRSSISGMSREELSISIKTKSPKVESSQKKHTVGFQHPIIDIKRQQGRG